VDAVWLVRRKFPDAPHYEMSGVVLGQDEFGTWIGTKAGATVRLPSRDERPADYDAVFCVPREDWFLAHFWLGHPAVEIYVDICSPAAWTDGRVTVIDLDFDVIRWNAAKGGTVELVDEDEFEEHRVSLGYPDDLQDAARRAAKDVLARVTAGDNPFNLAAASRWIEALSAL
jgi:protein associated with RNAse G/E